MVQRRVHPAEDYQEDALAGEGGQERRGLPDGLLCSCNAHDKTRARWTRAVEDHSAPIPEEVASELGGSITCRMRTTGDELATRLHGSARNREVSGRGNEASQLIFQAHSSKSSNMLRTDLLSVFAAVDGNE